jgi:hypothetical protein
MILNEKRVIKNGQAGVLPSTTEQDKLLSDKNLKDKGLTDAFIARDFYGKQKPRSIAKIISLVIPPSTNYGKAVYGNGKYIYVIGDPINIKNKIADWPIFVWREDLFDKLDTVSSDVSADGDRITVTTAKSIGKIGNSRVITKQSLDTILNVHDQNVKNQIDQANKPASETAEIEELPIIKEPETDISYTDDDFDPKYNIDITAGEDVKSSTNTTSNGVQTKLGKDGKYELVYNTPFGGENAEKQPLTGIDKNTLKAAKNQINNQYITYAIQMIIRIWVNGNNTLKELPAVIEFMKAPKSDYGNFGPKTKAVLQALNMGYFKTESDKLTDELIDKLFELPTYGVKSESKQITLKDVLHEMYGIFEQTIPGFDYDAAKKIVTKYKPKTTTKTTEKPKAEKEVEKPEDKKVPEKPEEKTKPKPPKDTIIRNKNDFLIPASVRNNITKYGPSEYPTGTSMTSPYFKNLVYGKKPTMKAGAGVYEKDKLYLFKDWSDYDSTDGSLDYGMFGSNATNFYYKDDGSGIGRLAGKITDVKIVIGGYWGRQTPSIFTYFWVQDGKSGGWLPTTWIGTTGLN